MRTTKTFMFTWVLFLLVHQSLTAQQIKLNCRETAGRLLLAWNSTADSVSCDFVIERSSDGVHYQEIGTLRSDVTCSENCAYSFYDKQPIHGMNFYRLKKRVDSISEITSAVVRRDFSTDSKPFRLLTNGKRITIQANQNISRLTVWNSNGQRFLDKESLQASEYAFTGTTESRFYFIMIELADGSRFTEKLGMQ